MLTDQNLFLAYFNLESLVSTLYVRTLSFLDSSTACMIIATLTLAVLIFGVDTALGDEREIQNPVLFANGDVTTPLGTVDNWHDRDFWTTDAAFTCVPTLVTRFAAAT